MQFEPLFQTSIISGSAFKAGEYPDIKPWVIKAIAEEEQKLNTQLWDDEPSVEFQYAERLRRIRLLRKHMKSDSILQSIIDRLESCEKYSRCCSGACPECGRLLQRWFVRRSKKLIRHEIEKPDQQLVAISIIPSTPIIRPGKLHTFSIKNMQRRLKDAIKKTDLGIIIVGGVDFSFNEDAEDKYQPFWCPHFDLLTSIASTNKVLNALTEIYKPDGKRIPKPVLTTPIENRAYRRSYALKITFKRRIGVLKKTSDRTFRDTSRDKLRAAERLELFRYLDQVGFADRFVFRDCKPIITKTKVRIQSNLRLRRRIKAKWKSRPRIPKKRQRTGSFGDL
jgi:hypothetical protein